jgi:hypothetical protein
VYWMESSSEASPDATSTIWRVPHGSTATGMVAAGLRVRSFWEQGDGLILLSQAPDADAGDDLASLLEVPKAGGCPRVLVSLPKSRCSCRIGSVAVDGRGIYWAAADSASAGYSIWSAPRNGGIAVQMSAALHDENLALSPTQAFWGDPIPAIRTFATLIQVMDRP